MGAGVGDTLGNTVLRDHMKSVLLTGDDLFKSQTLSAEIRVKHLDALYNFLWSQVSEDEFGQVHDVYKVKLTEGFKYNVGGDSVTLPAVDSYLLDELRVIAPRLELKKLLPCMARVMVDQLSALDVSTK